MPDETTPPSMDSDLAGIGVSKYPEQQLTVHPDVLHVGSGSGIISLGMQPSQSNAPNAYSGFGPNPNQYQLHSTSTEASTVTRGTHTRRNMNAVQETHAPLNLLADTALASPPNSVSQSRHAYSSGLSSNFAASPDKSITSDDQKFTEGTRLANALKAFVKELGTASDDQKDSVLRALQEASEEPNDTIGDVSNGKILGRSPHSARSSSYNSRRNVWDCAPSDGPDGRGDSASEQEEFRKGLALIAKGMKQARGSRSDQKSKHPPRSFPCPQPSCDKEFPRKCQLTLVFNPLL
jgi:hypothetical protein